MFLGFSIIKLLKSQVKVISKVFVCFVRYFFIVKYKITFVVSGILILKT